MAFDVHKVHFVYVAQLHIKLGDSWLGMGWTNVQQSNSPSQDYAHPDDHNLRPYIKLDISNSVTCLFLFRNCGIEDPSWAELRHFVNFLNSQLQSCEESTFCNMEHVGDTLEGFRSFVVHFMILMSRVRVL